MKRTVYRMGWAVAALLSVGFSGAQAWGAVGINVLSSHPKLVTGGDALIAIEGATGAPNVSVNGRDLSAAFKADPATGAWIGLIDGLRNGENQLIARSGSEQASVTLINHAINATLFAGPQQTPFLCEMEDNNLTPAPGARLDPKDAPDCAAVTTVTYFYRNRTGQWKTFDAQGARPSDIEAIKTSDGKNAALIVRQEKGVINRSAYILNVLHDPAAGPVPSPTNRGGSAWNGKLVYSFGGAVQANYHMGRKIGELNAGTQHMEDTIIGFRDAFITRGYAIAAGSLNVFGSNNDDVKSAETAAKIKERFIELYGPPIYTVGTGASGGSMQQHLISNAYPGIIDGVMASRSYADTMTFLMPLHDCELLARTFRTGTWTRAQHNAVSGKYWGYCVSNGTRYPNARPEFCDLAVIDLIEGDAALKAKGVRCTYQDNLVSAFGVDPKTGFARNPFDNVGVQYGLNALNDGVITFAQFIDINTRIGGLDADGKIVPRRMVGDELALQRAYETGRVMLGNGGATEVPIVSIRSYNDGDPLRRGDPNVDVHDGYHSEVVEARLRKYAGTSANYVQLMGATYGSPQLDAQTLGSPLNAISMETLDQLDKWLLAIRNDKSNRTKAQKVIANKPPDFVDACYPEKLGPIMGVFERVTDRARCKELFPTYGDARLAAGAPPTDDVFKCQLKPIDVRDYKMVPSADQIAELRKVFPDGVCDYSKPGVGQTGRMTPWAVFTGDGAFSGL